MSNLNWANFVASSAVSVTTAARRVLADNQIARPVIFEAEGATVYFGASNVSATMGISLAAGDQVSMEIAGPGPYFITASSATVRVLEGK